jgi:hypothetical protein
MIHLKEKFLDSRSVAIDVDGVIDSGTIPTLEAVCQRYLNEGTRVSLNLESVLHITREGRRFIQVMQEKVHVVNLPEFMKLEQGS